MNTSRGSILKSLFIASAFFLTTGCNTFALKYQNYFTANLAYFASKYDGNPADNLSAGAESNNFEGANLETYSTAKYPLVIAGFRTLEFQNTNYHKGNQFDFQFKATLIPPGKSDADAIPVATFVLDGKSLSYAKQLPEAQNVVLIKMSYPAVMVYLDNAALQKTYGSGTYTMVWTGTSYDGKPQNRELHRASTTLTP